MTAADNAGVFTIPAGVPFVDTLAAGLLERTGGDPLALSAMRILLPTRRAVRALRDAFLRQADGRPMLLPRMSPLGDIDPDPLEIEAEAAPGLATAAGLPPAIAGSRRRMLLARLILARGEPALGPAQALGLADELARLIDQVHTERLGFDRLADLVPEALARHWQQTVDFLTIVSEAWPAILAERGVIDPADRRNRVLALQADLWRAQPPETPVIAAGSTGSIPATADLLAVIAGLPAGAVVLPGLDRDMDDESWDALDDSHPQAGLKRLVQTIGRDRRSVPDWPAPMTGRVRPTLPRRRRLIRELMRPAATTDAWRGLAGALGPQATEGLSRLDCPTQREEAQAIALILRGALEEQESTAALVTADRELARRVVAEMRRWTIAINDSGGTPLADTTVGAFLRLTAEMAHRKAGPVALLALLKHPLAAAGLAPGIFRQRVRLLERAVLRGPAPGPGWQPLRRAVDGPASRFNDPAQRPVVAELVDRVGTVAEPFLSKLDSADPQPARQLLDAHLRFAEALAATDDTPGPSRLWSQDDGEAAARFANDSLDALEDLPPIRGGDYAALFAALMGGQVVRPRFGEHPRLSIWGPLEARLQSADLLVLGGLNEGTWPRETDIDPWMSRPMRRDFGLPDAERRVGLAAHDFAQALAAPTVWLTRADRTGGAPTVPSRWLLRLDAVLEGADLNPPSGDLPADWIRLLDAPDRVTPIRPPEPRPPVAARPRRLSVTAIEQWREDPYGLYARHVLKLEPLESLAAEPGAPERGQIVHAALAAFLRTFPPGDEPLVELMACGDAAFARWMDYPAVARFWRPRFDRIADWFVRRLVADREAGRRPLAVETAGRTSLAGPAGPFELRGRADRIDRTAEGGLILIDYKTGGTPGPKDVTEGRAPQLPLEGVLLADGALLPEHPAPLIGLEYWPLSGGDPAGDVRDVAGKADPATLVAHARARLEALIARFDDPATPYLSYPLGGPPYQTNRPGAYDHLARVREWAATGDGEEA